jgi:hypothetical protein
MLLFLVWWRSARLSFTWTVTGRPASKQADTSWPPAGDRPLYPAYAAGIRQLQAGGTVQTDHVGRFLMV